MADKANFKMCRSIFDSIAPITHIHIHHLIMIIMIVGKITDCAVVLFTVLKFYSSRKPTYDPYYFSCVIVCGVTM